MFIIHQIDVQADQIPKEEDHYGRTWMRSSYANIEIKILLDNPS